MRFFPVFLDVRGRAVLVLGKGEIARRKAEPLQRAGAMLRVAARFDPDDLTGCALAVGADAPEPELQALSAAAQAAGIPVNIVDRPDLCSFITPAIMDRDPIVVAISTGGAAPVLARLLRARIEAAVPPAFGALAALADSFKEAFRQRWPDMAARRRVLEGLFSGRAADLVFAGQTDAARAVFAAALAGDSVSAGIVHLVGGGPGAADLLTLRAQRLLGEADAVAYGPGVGAAVLDMARRDAARVASATLAEVAALARAGRKVVWLLPGDARGTDAAAALADAGVLFEVVPGVA